jgi:hypothetical protein
LLKLYSEILQELVRRKACHSTNNPVADIAELLVIEALRLTPATKSNKGYDAIDPSGKRYEIKGRRVTANNSSRMLSAIRDCNGRHFDYLAGVLFREDFLFDKACVVPFDVVYRRSTYRKHVNSHILDLKDDLWNTTGVVDISKQIAAVVARLDERVAQC